MRKRPKKPQKPAREPGFANADLPVLRRPSAHVGAVVGERPGQGVDDRGRGTVRS